jgi:hypothetical protein
MILDMHFQSPFRLQQMSTDTNGESIRKFDGCLLLMWASSLKVYLSKISSQEIGNMA